MTPKEWALLILAGDLTGWDDTCPADVAHVIIALDEALRPFAALDPANSEDVTTGMVRKARNALQMVMSRASNAIPK